MKIKHFPLLLNVLLASALFTACRKDQSASQSTEVQLTGSDRLYFTSMSQFKTLMTDLERSKDSEIEDKVSKISGKKDFISYRSALKLVNSKPKTLSAASEEDGDEPFQELVPDPYFASVLNDKLEVQVENVVYKVTPFGTFIFPLERYDRVIELLEENTYTQGQDLSNHLFYSNRMHDDFYRIKDKIILLDTYKRNDPLDKSIIKTIDYPVNSIASKDKKNVSISSSDLSDDVYEALPIIHFGAKTVFGKLFESLRGREEIYTEKFPTNSKRRVRVNFYNASWGVYSAIGVSVKFQKKNWIGWSETNCEQMRMGWDALEYYCGSLPSAPLIPDPYTPQKFTPVDLPYVTKQYVEVNLLGYPLVFDKNESIQRGAKQVFDFVKSIPSLNPKPVDYNYAVKVWTDYTKRGISIVQERDEQVGYNVESLSKRFDWAVGASIKSDFSDVSVGYAPLTFNLERASVYGMALCDGNWRGAHIVSE